MLDQIRKKMYLIDLGHAIADILVQATTEMPLL